MRLRALFLVLLLVAIPLASAHGSVRRTYIADVGASYGREGFATGRISGVGVFTSSHEHYGVRLTLTDAANADPFIAICVDLNHDDFCDDADGDLLWEGYGSVEGWSAEPFTEIIVFSDTVNWDPDTQNAHLSTRGEARVEWLEGQSTPTPPPSRELDAFEQLLRDLMLFLFGTIP